MYLYAEVDSAIAHVVADIIPTYLGFKLPPNIYHPMTGRAGNL